jgi:hypothetical protein
MTKQTHHKEAKNAKAVASSCDATRKPVYRGEEPTKKLHYNDNFELVAMRHREFRKVPNPTTADYVRYDRVIKKAVARFLYINTKVCRRHMLQFEDLLTYAQVWTANYLGLYRVTETDSTNSDNERKLYVHLCQRFLNFLELLFRKERNCITTPDVASIALWGRPFETKKTHAASDPDYDDTPTEEAGAEDVIPEVEGNTIEDELLVARLMPEEESEAEQREARLTEAKRRKAAKETLQAALDAMSHDKLIATLTEAAENTFICYDAQIEARKQLRIHRQNCAECIKMHKMGQKKPA